MEPDDNTVRSCYQHSSVAASNVSLSRFTACIGHNRIASQAVLTRQCLYQYSLTKLDLIKGVPFIDDVAVISYCDPRSD